MKKILPLLLATAMLLCVIGCKPGGENTVPTGTEPFSSCTTVPTHAVPSTETTVPTETTSPVENTDGETTAPTETTTIPEASVPTQATEATQPTETAPVETVKPTEATKPTESTRPTEGTEPTETEPEEAVKPTQATTPNTEPAPTKATEPTQVTSPATEPKDTPETTSPTCAHSFQTKVLRNSTCKTNGTARHVCSECGYSKVEALPLADHKMRPANCTSPSTCTICGHTEGKSLGHQYQNYICTVCGETDSAAPVDWTISISAKNGKPLANVTVDIFSDSKLSEKIGSGTTDKNGILTITLDNKWTYHAVLSGYDETYNVKTSYPLYTTDLAIELPLRDGSDQDMSGSKLKVGSTVSDFTVYDIDGEQYNLAELLGKKDLVILNFWYVNCGPCKAEFPHMDSVYREYSDRIEILAMDHYTGDSLSAVRDIRENLSLSFPMIKENLGFDKALDITGYPTTVIIDSTGSIVYIRTGSFTSEQEFRSILDIFLK